MRLTPPKKIVWWIALVVAVLGLLGRFVAIPVVSGIAFWLEVVAAALMLLSTSMKGL